MNRARQIAAILAMGALVLGFAADAQADVFSMPPGQTSLQFVAVGNPGNAGELSGAGAGGVGENRICGAVAYAYNIGTFEVTAGQYVQFLNAVAATDTYGLYNASMNTSVSTYGCNIKRTGSGPGSYQYAVASDWANRPVNFVSWGDAARFANWLTHGQPIGVQDLTTTEDGSYYLNGATTDVQLLAVTRKTPQHGGRYYIPTEDEWYKAAYHKGDGATAHYWDYATESDVQPGNVVSPVDPGNRANYYYTKFSIGSPYYRTPVGEFENSESAYDTFDQDGNVAEWNEAVLSTGLQRGVRGGAFNSLYSSLKSNYRNGAFPSSESFTTGFRLVEIPEPATMAMLTLGSAAMLLIRRRGSGR